MTIKILLLAAVFSVPNYKIEYLKHQFMRYGLDQSDLQTMLADERLKVVHFEKKKPDWANFRNNLMEVESVDRGKKFLQENITALQLAESFTGVEKEYITSVIRVESNLGENRGQYQAINVFFTKLHGNSWRDAARQMASLAAYCKKLDQDCFTITSSHAGAFGFSQFMPLSIPLAKDGNNDGRIDLFDMNDAILSTANFLAKHGWRKNKARALAAYYGSKNNYPAAVIQYSNALTGKTKKNTSIKKPPGHDRRRRIFIVSFYHKACRSSCSENSLHSNISYNETLPGFCKQAYPDALQP